MKLFRLSSKILSVLLILAILMSLMPASLIAAAAPPGYKAGDADGDGDVDLQDVFLIERYMADKNGAALSTTNADVNGDEIVDADDAWLIREYLVGNVATLPQTELCTITFDTDGGSAVNSIKATRGFPVKKEIPSPVKEDYVFAGWQKEDGSEFYKEDAVLGNMTLKAVYEVINENVQFSIDSFALTDIDPDTTIKVIGSYTFPEEVLPNLTLIVKDGSTPVNAEVTSTESGTFNIGASGGFRAGGSYSLTLGEGLDFADMDPAIRTVNITVKKEESNNLVFNENLIFIKDTEEMKYTLDGIPGEFEVLDLAVISGDDDNGDITGSFTMASGSLSVGNLVCIYEKEDPNIRNYSIKDYSDDSIAYIEITAAESDGVYKFKGLDSENIYDILFIPESIPYKVTTLPTGNGTLEKADYDSEAWGCLGFPMTPKFRVNDFLVFYISDFAELNNSSLVKYGQITSVEDNNISYKLIVKSEIESFMGVYSEQAVEAETLMAGIQDLDGFLANIAEQTKSSGFAGYASEYMLTSALQTDTLRSSLLENGITEAEIDRLPGTLSTGAQQIGSTAAGAGGRVTVSLEEGYPNVKAGVTYDEGRFKNGVAVTLTVQVIFNVEKKISVTETSQLKIELTASFTQEIGVYVSGEADEQWNWWGPIPYVNELYVGVSVDIKNYTYVSVGAKIYTNTENNSNWTKLKSASANPDVQAYLRKINNLQAEVARVKKYYEAVNEYNEQIKSAYNAIKSLTNVDYEALELDLGMLNVGAELSDVLNADNSSDFKVGLDQLMDKYAEMLKNETDWVKLYDQQVLKQQIDFYKLIVGSFTVDFVIRVNVNISLGAEVEYQIGKRFNFWFNFNIDERSARSGSSEMDLLDERFGFQFYVMGTLGIRAGMNIAIEVGIISTKAASIGMAVEFGPYLKLWGYFIYVYTKNRPQGQSQWFTDQKTMGALYIEFGVYVLVTAKAQAFSNLIKYEPTLYEGEFPLLYAGVRKNVYDFAYTTSADDVLYIRDADSNSANGIAMNLPAHLRLMKSIDLREGAKLQEIYPVENFHYSSSNNNIKVDQNGRVTVTPPAGTRYMEGELTLTWKVDKLAFSAYDISVTIPVIWTNMTMTQINEKFSISVAVGNSVDGYKTVWNQIVGRFDVFDLPSADTILTLLGYHDFDHNGFNLKYGSTGQYKDSKTSGLSATTDYIYYYEIPLRNYELNVSGVVNADGSIMQRTFRTTYGNPFNLSALKNTGADVPESHTYSKFANLMFPLGDSETATVFDSGTIANLAFYEKYGESLDLTANYADTCRTAIFKFVGIDAPDYEVKFKKGTTLDYSWLYDYVKDNGGEELFISFSSPIAASEHSVTYTVHCSQVELNQEAQDYTIQFVTNDGTEISAITRKAGEPIGELLNQAVTKKDGNTFVEWYELVHVKFPFNMSFYVPMPFTYDENTVMPDRNLTLHAKWEPNIYTLTFYNGSDTETRSITYGDAYGNAYADDVRGLPKPEQTGSVFSGWFTDQDGNGTMIDATTIFEQAENQNLYAYWKQVQTITDKYISYNEEQNYLYDTKNIPRPFKFKLSDLAAGTDLTIDDFKVTYIWQGDIPDGEYTETPPTQGGTYNVKLECTNSAYQWDNEYELEGVIKILPIEMDLASKTEAYTIGETVVIKRPEGVETGRITYHFDNTENNTGVFKKGAGTWNYRVSVGESRNYLSATTEMQQVEVNGLAAGGYAVALDIWTTKNGTGSTVDAKFFRNGYGWYPTPSTVLQAGWYLFGADFSDDSYNECIIANYIMPWEIGGYLLWKAPGGLLGMLSDDWEVFRVDLKTWDLHGNKQDTTRYTVDISPDVPPYKFTNDNQTREFRTDVFKRQISGLDGFDNGGADSINLNALQSDKYEYNWYGNVFDQYYVNGISAFLYAGMEYYIVTAVGANAGTDIEGNPNNIRDEYNQFIKFNSVTGFTIDSVRLRDYMIEKNRTGSIYDFEYFVEIAFYESMTSGERIFTKKIKVTAPEAPEQEIQSLMDAQFEFEQEPAPEPGAIPDPEPAPESGAIHDPEHDPEPGAIPDPEHDPEPGAIPDQESDPELDPTSLLSQGVFENSAQAVALFSNPLNKTRTVSSAVLTGTNSTEPAILPLAVNNSTLTISAGSAEPSDGLVEIPIRISGNTPAWGVLANVSYDSDALELVGCAYGSVFTGNKINTQNDLNTVPFTFLATSSDMNAADANGSIVLLTFRVKTNATTGNLIITVNVMQVIGAQGDIINAGSINGEVRLGTAVPPGVIGNIDSGTPTDTGKTTKLPGGSTVHTPPGGDAVLNADGSLTLPQGGTIITSKGVTIEVPPGTGISADGGTVRIPNGRVGAVIIRSDGTIQNVGPGMTITIVDGDVPLGGIYWFNPFNDVSENDWFYDSVQYVYTRGLMTGTSETPMQFSPNATLTRGMVVTVLYRIENSPDVTGLDNPFDDVEAGTWYTDAVIWAYHNGIVSGYGNAKFGPNDNITRQDMAVMLNNYAVFANMDLPVKREYTGFVDDKNIAGYAKEAIERFFSAAVINGKPGNAFDPTGNATRAEFATMLMNFIVSAEQTE